MHLRRLEALFKDYSHTPIGFGISIFCLARDERKELYPKFFEHFGDHGEPNIPIDREFVGSEEFWQLLNRLKIFSENHDRDHWIQCCRCGKWRIVPLLTVKNLSSKKSVRWDCSKINPHVSSCSTPLTRLEYIGGYYAPKEEAEAFAYQQDPGLCQDDPHSYLPENKVLI